MSDIFMFSQSDFFLSACVYPYRGVRILAFTLSSGR